MAEQHEFKPTARFLALYAAATVILCVVLAVAWPPFPTMLVVATPIGSTWGFYSAISLRISPTGVEQGHRSATWDDLTLHRGLWGESLRSRPGSGGRAQRINAYLPVFEADWRRGVIGQGIAKWAPRLLGANEDLP